MFVIEIATEKATLVQAKKITDHPARRPEKRIGISQVNIGSH